MQGDVKPYVIESVLLEDGVPVALVLVVLDDDDLELVLPLRVQGKQLLGQAVAAHGADDLVAGRDERVDDVRSNEGVGTGHERGRHLGGWCRGDGYKC